MKVYITKYALTEGIVEAEAEVWSDVSDRMISLKTHMPFAIVHKPDWHETRAQAVERAYEMKSKKINSLKKQLKRVDALEFK